MKNLMEIKMTIFFYCVHLNKTTSDPRINFFLNLKHTGLT